MTKAKSQQFHSPKKELKLQKGIEIKGKRKGLGRKAEKFIKEIQLLREQLVQKETELNQLREQLRYKNQQLASKDLELESYKKISEERIILLEAKIKELEAKLKPPTSQHKTKRGALKEAPLS